MIKRLFVIGDSFTVPCRYTKGWDDSVFWIEVLRNHFLLDDDNVYVDGTANRDVQTIIDNWIKLIPQLTKEDAIIICLPYFKRTRVPVIESSWYNPFNKQNQSDVKIINRFYGPQMINQHTKLEFWDDELTSKQLTDMMFNYEIMNSSKSAQLNQIEVIESLIKLTPCRSFVFTWSDMEYKFSFIEDKPLLTKEIGFWQTLNDEWYETNGMIGQKLDFHWGSKFNPIFGEYVFGKLKK
jgi:hypothetical protein